MSMKTCCVADLMASALSGSVQAQDDMMSRAKALFKSIPEQPPESGSNPLTPDKVELGKMLFFDPRLSESHSISCNSCHNMGLAGVMVRLGQQIFVDTQTHAAEFVGNELNCTNCHLDQGRKPNSSPLWAAYTQYPAYRNKNNLVSTFEERLQGCFRYSMNGTPPPSGSETLTALVSYSYWLSTGAPTGKVLPGRGYPVVEEPAVGQDLAHGEKIFQANCTICHGADGQGQKVNASVVFPALWGDKSFNWGAGMHRISTAAGFIKGNMPLGHGGSLNDRDAWDVAAYMNSHERPQDPRFDGDTEATRKQFHQHQDFYGQVVDGKLLGGN